MPCMAVALTVAQTGAKPMLLRVKKKTQQQLQAASLLSLSGWRATPAAFDRTLGQARTKPAVRAHTFARSKLIQEV